MAARFWIGGGTNTNWNASPTTNWSATSGGAVRVAAPTISDDVTFDGAGAGNGASVVSANISCLSLTFTSGYTSTITINTSVTLTIAGNFTDNTAHGWTVNGTGAMTISAASTITSGGKTFPGPVSLTGSNTKALSGGDWTISGALITSGTLVLNGNTLFVGGSFSPGGGMSGTTTINMNGTGTWSGASTQQNNLTLSGTVTLSGNIAYGTGTLTVSGTLIPGSSTLTLGISCTLDTNGKSFNNVSISNSITVTLNSLLSVSAILTIAAGISPIFAGTAGFIANTLTCSSTGGGTMTLANTVTYSVTTAFNAFRSSVGSLFLFTSDHASNKAILTLQNASTTCNVLASFTRIDAGGGRPIITFNGVITDSINVASQSNVLFRPVTSFYRGNRRFELTNKNKAVIYQ